MNTLISYSNKEIKDATNLVLGSLIDNYKTRGSLARTVRLTLTASTSLEKIGKEASKILLDLIKTRRHAIIDLLAQKTCLSGKEEPSASAIALLEEVEQKIKAATTGDHRDIKRKFIPKKPNIAGVNTPAVKEIKIESNKTPNPEKRQVFVKNYNLGEGLSLSIFKQKNWYNIVIKERGEIVKDAFRCEKYEIDTDAKGIKYLSIYYKKGKVDADWGYTLLFDNDEE